MVACGGSGTALDNSRLLGSYLALPLVLASNIHIPCFKAVSDHITNFPACLL